MRLLSSQMAISIDNARSHAELESLLETRSKALASAEAQVRTLFEDSPLGIALSRLRSQVPECQQGHVEDAAHHGGGACSNTVWPTSTTTRVIATIC